MVGMRRRIYRGREGKRGRGCGVYTVCDAGGSGVVQRTGRDERRKKGRGKKEETRSCRGVKQGDKADRTQRGRRLCSVIMRMRMFGRQK